MTTSILSKLISRPALLASAAILLNTGSALAADHAGDAQAQARELLAGAANRSAVLATSIAVPTGTSQTDLDPQEQARRLILGTPRTGSDAKGQPTLSSNSASSSVAGQRLIRRAYPDAHALAQRMITGKAG
jgi:hypothetical protein